jgi:hypothetical protein
VEDHYERMLDLEGNDGENFDNDEECNDDADAAVDDVVDGDPAG